MIMKKVYLLLSLSLLSLMAKAQITRMSCDEACSTDAVVTTNPIYSVVSPVGFSTVKPIKMAPRLSTLNGKTIAVVGVSFMADITHQEIKRLIEKHYPAAKVLMTDDIGTAGVYPTSGIRRRTVEEFQQNLRDMNVDAVISGNGGCGLCTPKETGSCIAAEMIGIPSVIIAGPGFVEEARYTAHNSGIPALRVAEYPGAFASHSKEELISNTDNILWKQIVTALTTPITEEEMTYEKDVRKGIQDDVFQGTIDEINAYFTDMKWSDGLPIIPPTYDKVMEYMKYTDMSWDETVAVLPLAQRNTTAWHVAVNACMAGCKPEYMPILIAMTKALGGPAFRRTLSSTHAWIPYSWISGPVARQLGISNAQGEINDEANISIGRFMNLALMNLSGYYIGQDRMGTFGYPMSWCLAEDETACHGLGWLTWNERQGFDINANTITCASALLWGNNMAPSTTDPEKTMELMAWDITERCQFALGSGKQFTNRVVLMTEPVAAILARKYRTLDDLENTLIKVARRPLKERAFANYYANPGSRKDGGAHSLQQYTGHLRATEGASLTPTPSWYDSRESALLTIPTMEKGSTAFIITGDNARNKVQTMPGGGFSTIKVTLPKNWDSLVAALGYKNLSSFYIR